MPLTQQGYNRAVKHSILFYFLSYSNLFYSILLCFFYAVSNAFIYKAYTWASISKVCFLTLFERTSKYTWANSVDPDQTPQNATQGPHRPPLKFQDKQ